MSYHCGNSLKLSALWRNTKQEDMFYATLPPCELILHNVLVLQDFYRESVKALLLYQLKLRCV